MTYIFPKFKGRTNFNGCTVEVCEWISNFTPHFMMDVIAYPYWDYNETMLVKGALYGKIAGILEMNLATALIY